MAFIRARKGNIQTVTLKRTLLDRNNPWFNQVATCVNWFDALFMVYQALSSYKSSNSTLICSKTVEKQRKSSFLGRTSHHAFKKDSEVLTHKKRLFSVISDLLIEDDRLWFNPYDLFIKDGHLFIKDGHLLINDDHLLIEDDHPLIGDDHHCKIDDHLLLVNSCSLVGVI